MKNQRTGWETVDTSTEQSQPFATVQMVLPAGCRVVIDGAGEQRSHLVTEAEPARIELQVLLSETGPVVIDPAIEQLLGPDVASMLRMQAERQVLAQVFASKLRVV